MDKLRRVLSGREDNEELGLTAQVNFSFLVNCPFLTVYRFESRGGADEAQ